MKLEYWVEPYGLYVKLSGRVCYYESSERIADFKLAVSKIKKPFNLLLDFSKVMPPVCTDAMELLNLGRLFLLENQLKRIVILYETNAQIVDIAKMFPNVQNHSERYVSTMLRSNASERAIKYLMEGEEP